MLAASDTSEYLLYTPAKDPVGLASIGPALGAAGFFWLDVCNPTAGDFEALRERLRVHPLTLEDVQLREVREKCEAYDAYVFLSVQLLDEQDFYGRIASPQHAAGRGPAKDTDASSAPAALGAAGSSIYLLVFPTCLVTLHWQPLALLPRVLARRMPLAEGLASAPSADWLAYVILDEVVDDFTKQAALLQSEIDVIEDLTLTLGRFDQADMLRRIYQAHRRTAILYRLIQPKIDTARLLIKRSFALFQPRTLVYLRDVQDHLHALRHTLTEHTESLSRAHDNYLGQSEIEAAMASHRINMAIKKITAITVVVGSAVTVSSVMGMNIRVPFHAFPDEPALADLTAFLTLLLATLSAVVLTVTVGRYRKWV